ncbi:MULTISPECIES: methyltransferase domain-containing protein [Streptomyces]|uniref:methyltransferase domain-containing protein n=1 Tax=Streptomyces TaxID=1883 RepID=UPI000A30E437|nr:MULTISPECIES: methyltransferase domain-containing protein [Streptomyces]MYS92185.1 methyltransferase domain-containing protein [Streptomyces sp. SID5464]
MDAGCGDGLLTRKPAARAASVTGVDRSPAMIGLARGYAHVPVLGGGLPRRRVPARRRVRPRQRGRRGPPRAVRGGGDWVVSACGVPASMLYARLNGAREARPACPCCVWRRTLLWRYVVVWDRPREGGP